MKKILFYFFLIEATLGCSGKQPFFQKNQNDKRWILEWSEDFENPTEFDDYWNAENYAPSHILSSRWRDNVIVQGGMLYLNNRKEFRGGKNWTSGSVTYKKSVGYGYLECKMKISAAIGINNSFWLYNWSREYHHAFEIDIVEAQYPNIVRTNIHDNGYREKKSNIQASKKIEIDKNLSTDFHVFGLEWSRDTLKFYLDGRLIRSEKNKVCTASAKLVLGTAILDWAGPITDSIDGTHMMVDYVRYYKLKE